MYYECVCPWVSEPAAVEIDGDRLTVREGAWPDLDMKSVAIAGATVVLEPTDAFVHFDRDGGVVVADNCLPYGRSMEGGIECELLDLIAWRDGGEWHIKRLVPDA